MQAIIVRWMPSTNRRGVRYKVQGSGGGYARTYSAYAEGTCTPALAAERFACELGWRGTWFMQEMPTHYLFVCNPVTAFAVTHEKAVRHARLG